MLIFPVGYRLCNCACYGGCSSRRVLVVRDGKWEIMLVLVTLFWLDWMGL